MLPPPPPSLGVIVGHPLEKDSKTSEMGFQILNPSIEKRVGDGYLGDERKGLSVKFGEEEEGKSSGAGKSGHTKLCARGHWRPAEDAKLKELVAQYGPQNWNLIAENLEGRSGNSNTPTSKS